MPSSSVVVVTLYALCVFVTLLRADYEVILNHKDVADGNFSADLPSTGLENVDNPGANTYSIIGNFDAAKREEYQNDDGAYKLKLLFTYADGTTDLLEWTQTSWITEATITGFNLIRAIGTDGLDYDLSQDEDGNRFRGLGLNVGDNNIYSYLDGNGAYTGSYYQAVGVMIPWNDGIPGMRSSYDAGHGTAQSETLWISAPGADYIFVSDQGTKNWFDAEAYCAATYGTHLASWSTLEQAQELQILLGNVAVWIGLRLGTNEFWEFSDGSVDCRAINGNSGCAHAANFDYWYGGEPNGDSGINNDCAHTIPGQPIADWLNDRACDTYLLPFACNAPIRQVVSCLAAGHSLTAWYQASSFTSDSSAWPDSSGNGHDATITSGTLNLFDGVDTSNALYLNGQPSVYGTTTTKVTFGAALSVAGAHTVFNLCKYNGESKKTIIRGYDVHFFFGFEGGKSGVAGVFASADSVSIVTDLAGELVSDTDSESDSGDAESITDSVDRFGTNWVLSSQAAGFYRGNGFEFTQSDVDRTRQVAPGVLEINVDEALLDEDYDDDEGPVASETSDFACAEVLIFNNQILSDEEVQCVETYFNEKYNLWDTNVCYAKDTVTAGAGNLVQSVPIGDDGHFEFDVMFNSLPLSGSISVFQCGWENAFFPAVSIYSGTGFRFSSIVVDVAVNVQTGQSYHIEVDFNQMTMWVTIDGVVRYSDDVARHDTYDAVPCFEGTADAVITNLVISSRTSCVDSNTTHPYSVTIQACDSFDPGSFQHVSVTQMVIQAFGTKGTSRFFSAQFEAAILPEHGASTTFALAEEHLVALGDVYKVRVLVQESYCMQALTLKAGNQSYEFDGDYFGAGTYFAQSCDAAFVPLPSSSSGTEFIPCFEDYLSLNVYEKRGVFDLNMHTCITTGSGVTTDGLYASVVGKLVGSKAYISEVLSLHTEATWNDFEDRTYYLSLESAMDEVITVAINNADLTDEACIDEVAIDDYSAPSLSAYRIGGDSGISTLFGVFKAAVCKTTN